MANINCFLLCCPTFPGALEGPIFLKLCTRPRKSTFPSVMFIIPYFGQTLFSTRAIQLSSWGQEHICRNYKKWRQNGSRIGSSLLYILFVSNSIPSCHESSGLTKNFDEVERRDICQGRNTLNDFWGRVNCLRRWNNCEYTGCMILFKVFSSWLWKENAWHSQPHSSTFSTRS